MNKFRSQRLQKRRRQTRARDRIMAARVEALVATEQSILEDSYPWKLTDGYLEKKVSKYLSFIYYIELMRLVFFDEQISDDPPIVKQYKEPPTLAEIGRDSDNYLKTLWHEYEQ